MRKAWILLVLMNCLLSGCYEDRLGCLDPDATNYDVRADDACPDDCCDYPRLRLDVARNWGDTTLADQDELADGAGNVFEITRFRYYLSDLAVATAEGEVPVENIVEAAVVAGTDTLLTEVNANLVLVESSGNTLKSAGELRVGAAALTQVRGLFGTSDGFPNVFPPRAPSGSPLATQAGLLNFNDGNGYLLGSLEILLLPDSTARRIDLTGNLPLVVDFGGAVDPLRGVDLTVELAADYRFLLGDLDLRGDATAIAEGLRQRLPEFVMFTGLR